MLRRLFFQEALQTPHYGFDAPSAVRNFLGLGIGLLFVIVFGLVKYHALWWVDAMTAFLAVPTLFFFFFASTIILGGKVFKFRERDWLLSHVRLVGSEKTLDVGCGRGLLLVAVAKKLTTGRAVGLDLWAKSDMANNSPEATLRNAALEGVSSRVEVHTGDMRRMPFEEQSFDLVTSSWAIHNIDEQSERLKALQEIVRVLKTGGTVAILDIFFVEGYADFFKQQGLKDVCIHGPRYTFGNKTFLVTAIKA